MTEVMFLAEKLKRSFVEKMADKKDDAEHQADVGVELEDKSAGERHNGATYLHDILHAY